MGMSLERWLNSFAAPNTRYAYRSIINRLIRLNQVELEAFVKDCRDDPKRAMSAVDTYALEHLQSKARKTQASHISIMKTFFQDMYVDIPAHFWSKFKRRRRGGTHTVIREDIPTGEDIRQVFEHLPLEGRALFSLMAAAGTRIGESVLIEFADMELDADPPRIHLREETTKNHRSRVVFITAEAKDTLEQWLRVRDRWFEQSSKKGFPRTESMEKRVFPYSRGTATIKWRKGLKDAGLYRRDRATKWMTMRPHTLRKRFRTQLAAVIPVDAVEAMMGHAGYQTDAYRRFTEDELAGFYSEGEWVLYLSADRAEIEQMRKRVREVEQKQDRIDELAEEVALLKLRSLQESEED